MQELKNSKQVKKQGDVGKSEKNAKRHFFAPLCNEPGVSGIDGADAAEDVDLLVPDGVRRQGLRALHRRQRQHLQPAAGGGGGERGVTGHDCCLATWLTCLGEGGGLYCVSPVSKFKFSKFSTKNEHYTCPILWSVGSGVVGR